MSLLSVRSFVRSFVLQEAARHDPDNAEYRGLIKQYKLMESTKEAGNKAFKANDLQVLETSLP